MGIRKLILATSILIALTLTGCGDKGTGAVQQNGVSTGEINAKIVFDNDKVNADTVDGLSISEREVKITKPGLYTFSGTWSDGQILVDVGKESEAVLVLDGVNITNKKSAPIYVKSAEKVKIELADGKDNVLTDAEFYEFDDPQDNKPNACLYGKDDITIKGNGNLIVNANYNNGIGTSNDLKITGGNITVRAFNNGLKGNDSVTISGGNIDITSEADGIKVDNAEEVHKGFVNITGGSLKIRAKDDAIDSVRSVTVNNADVKVSVGGREIKCEGILNIAEGCISPLEE
ncbi:carbohydrate-binding domain-containing protein [Acetivibrio straminisolvens]|uniref:Large exoprotein n=1 Tax=Acetivibrio straminisolvens JCM 21531 TaxID=1294263 RepID=W4V9A1_9FIRM|nr:carbohydrate-binding domain-containing protein [Acetivibrio straminisolvens]GAE89756.1 large exoprotein [Acetivibrio straminisolvens JCM 21531]